MIRGGDKLTTFECHMTARVNLSAEVSLYQQPRYVHLHALNSYMTLSCPSCSTRTLRRCTAHKKPSLTLTLSYQPRIFRHSITYHRQ